jgi:hypothetical protein
MSKLGGFWSAGKPVGAAARPFREGWGGRVARRSKSGKFNGRTTVHVTLKFPMTKPDSCTVAVIASLNR